VQRRHPELKNKVATILRDLEKDPFQPQLDYHHLSGKQTGIQALSITDSCRITLTVMITKKEIILLDIGTHDAVYK
jgi:mRNA-degrading endonuclease YafQ of YafQ-DinJ toxin-antitoxin module